MKLKNNIKKKDKFVYTLHVQIHPTRILKFLFYYKLHVQEIIWNSLKDERRDLYKWCIHIKFKIKKVCTVSWSCLFTCTAVYVCIVFDFYSFKTENEEPEIKYILVILDYKTIKQ